MANEQTERSAPVHRAGLLLTFLIFVAGLLTAALAIFASNSGSPLLQPAAFLLLGTASTAVQQWLFPASRGGGFGAALLFALALFAGWVVMAMVAHNLHWKQLGLWFCAFSLPLVVAEAWRQFSLVNEATKPVWFYTSSISDRPPFTYLENKAVRLRVLSADGLHEEFATTAPLTVPLGLVFFYAITEGRSREEWQSYFFDEAGHTSGWYFYTPGLLYGKNYLHPYETLNENKLDASTVIVAERLQTMNTSSAPNKTAHA